ncbi:YggS family pyridoxal phosphate-dependent enzyme [uncultured Methanomethylovorans sp.]|jgi:pyridoxal phosphate enzyme (YggS family)|uniref:YggS family pyridoxal phosphate-dependent enzyme n=1 Tax=uncultured Methanomethylovorans sp. TaxID=183759 RepID=UPI00262614EF|nr:YggS family pyridoxal phosphate-dependent enzyme [uncultured Methanomethylovorans sp.]
MTVYQNVKAVLKELGNTKLVCVTKTIDAQRINESIRAGATIIGESKVQEYESKCDDLLPCEKHFIGHLQSKKVKKAVQLFDVIQSVDSLKLIQDINKKAWELGKVQKIFLQINIGKEPQKFGFAEDEIAQVITEIHGFKNINVEGLMCIPPFDSHEQTRSCFKRMKALFDEMQQTYQENVDIQELSMGMSSDYRIAIEEGATMVRIGSSIFGDRKY